MSRRPLTRRDRDGREGQALVEFALVVPLLLLLLLAIVGYGLALFRTLNVANAARSAVRYGVIGASPCQMFGDVVYLMPGTTPTMTVTFPGGSQCTIATNGSTVSQSPSGCDTSSSNQYTAGGYMTVQVANPVSSPIYLPGLGTSYTITQATTMMVEDASTVPSVPGSGCTVP